MKLISFEMGGQMRSMVIPSDVAAFAFTENARAGKAALFFRMKKADDHSHWTSFQKAQKEVPKLEWTPAGTNSWLETNDGLEVSAASYAQISFSKSDKGEWVLEYLPGMGEFISRQGDLRETVTKLPPSLTKEANEVINFLKILAGAEPQPVEVASGQTETNQ